MEVRPVPARVAAAEWLAAQPGQFRVYSPSFSLPPGDGLEHVDGVSPLQLKTAVAFIERASGAPSAGYSVTVPPFASGEVATANAAAVPDAQLLGQLNVKYVAAEFPLDAPGLTLVQTFGATRVYVNEKVRPRVWLEDETSGSLVRDFTFTLEEWSPDRLRLRAAGPGRLVLSEVMYPGWTAQVDGRRVDVLTAHGLLRAVDLGPGVHTVVMEFKPRAEAVGVGLGWLGLALLGLMLWRPDRAGATG
jgi:hypothetical protein